MNTKIFVITHKLFTPPADPMYVPLQVGRAKNGDLGAGYLGDDTGDNISELNPQFVELTGMYWIWKNYNGPEDCIGINHYRRYFFGESDDFLTSAEIEEILKDINIL